MANLQLELDRIAAQVNIIVAQSVLRKGDVEWEIVQYGSNHGFNEGTFLNNMNASWLNFEMRTYLPSEIFFLEDGCLSGFLVFQICMSFFRKTSQSRLIIWYNQTWDRTEPSRWVRWLFFILLKFFFLAWLASSKVEEIMIFGVMSDFWGHRVFVSYSARTLPVFLNP